MNDRGAATVIAGAVIAFLILVALGVVAAGSVIGARARAVTAADAAALAAAAASFPPAPGTDAPVEEARRMAVANRGRLVRCLCPVDVSLRPRTVTVVVEVEATLPLFGPRWVRATSRAEFDPVKALGG